MKNYDDFEMALDEVIDEVVEAEIDNVIEKAPPEFIGDPLKNIPVFDDFLPDSDEDSPGFSCECNKKFNLLSKKLDKISGSLTFHYWVEAVLLFVVILYMILDFLIKG